MQVASRPRLLRSRHRIAKGSDQVVEDVPVGVRRLRCSNDASTLLVEQGDILGHPGERTVDNIAFLQLDMGTPREYGRKNLVIWEKALL